jgi:large subunit ribosomal protein L9
MTIFKNGFYKIYNLILFPPHSMKVILLQNVPSLGRKFDIVNVKDGYALNFLFPKSIAKVATDAALKEVEVRKKKELIKIEETKAFEKEIADKVKGIAKITLLRKTSAKDHLFAAVGEKDITDALKDAIHVELSLQHIEMKEHIKTLGEHTVYIVIGDTKTALIVDIEKSDKK